MLLQFLSLKTRKNKQVIYINFEFATVLDISGMDFKSGISLCFRVYLKLFNLSCMLKSTALTLEFRDYKSRVAGVLKINKKYYVFGWPGILNLPKE